MFFSYSVHRACRKVDFITLALALVCAGYGLALIYAATFARFALRYVAVQAVAIVLGIALYFVLQQVNCNQLQPFWLLFLCSNIALQASLLVFGVAEGSNRSWLRFGGIGLQPAEVGKVLFILSFAGHIHAMRNRVQRLSTLLGLLLHAGVTVGAIVLTSHDLGMALVYGLLAVIMLFAGGVRLRWFVLLGVGVACAVPVLLPNLQTYQLNRILVLYNPALSPDTYYQTLQSKIALGSGQLYGQGWLNGTQTQYGLLPASHTDFIFSVAGEAFGFVGCAVMVGLLFLLILRLFTRALRAQDMFSRMVAVGVAGMLALQATENIAMCLGLFPVMGLTLPLFSYGGSSMVATFGALAIAQKD